MCSKSNFLTVCGILSIMFTFILGGLVYALSIDEPSGGTLTTGSTTIVELSFGEDDAAFQYRLYYCCGTCPATIPPWEIITIRKCNYYGVCPTKYYWVVPFVSPLTPNCKLGVRLLDDQFNEIGRAISATFKIPSPIFISPPYVTVSPGGSAQFWVAGGTPPYVVNTDNNGIMTAPFPVTVANPRSGYIKNTYTCGSDTTVTITVRDSSFSTATSSYNIDCP